MYLNWRIFCFLIVVLSLTKCDAHTKNASNETSRRSDAHANTEYSGVRRVNAFREGVLTFHNYLRNIHEAPGLRLNALLNTQAHQLASEAKLKGKFEHQEGENTFMLCAASNYTVTPKEAVEFW